MLKNPFKPIPLYVKLYSNYMEVIRLDTHTKAQSTKQENFSSSRQVIADFEQTEKLLRKLVDELLIKKPIFYPSFKMLLQQMENFEGGLSSIERRAILDVSEMTGSKYTAIITSKIPLTIDQAIKELDNFVK